jgi:hypothetical protein
MAEVEVAVQEAAASGIKPAEKGSLNSADTHLIDNSDGNTKLLIKNGGSETTKVTIVTNGTEAGLAIADREVEIPAGESRIIGPFDRAAYNNKKEKLEVKFTKVTSLVVSPFKG